jgi:hypothetical protein
LSAPPTLTLDRPRSPKLASFVVAVVAAVVVLLFWLMLRSTSKQLVERLGVPEGATDISDIDVSWADGPAPEIATRSFRVAGGEPALRQFYVERCEELGLVEPPASTLRTEPTTLCERPDAKQSVLLAFRCESATCSVFIRVYVLS